MIITEKQQAGLVTFTSSTEAEENFLVALRLAKDSGTVDRIRYCGRSGAEVRSPYSERMMLNFAVGELTIKLQASDDESEKSLRGIRDTCYLSTDNLFLTKYTEEDGKLNLHFCAGFCQHCNAPVIDRARVSWRTCDNCVEKCKHEYIEGMISSRGLPGYGEFCSKCGSGKPLVEGKRERTKIEQELDIENKLGIKIIYKGSGPKTPRQAIEEKRFAKRYLRAKSRR